MIGAVAGAICLLVLSLLSLTTVAWLRRYTRRLPGSGEAPALETLRPTSVIVPCKGDDGTLLENLDLLVQQEHPDIEYVLVTATADDPAQAVFAELKRRHPHRRIKTPVAGIPTACSQQNNNQIKGVREADPRSEVLVIVDSDGQADKRFIAKLTAPLADPKIGATSGYRWYQPRWNSLADILRTAWNAGGFAFLVNPQTAFVWGGAMALRRSTYDGAGIEEVWAKALSDDMTLSRRLKAKGLDLKFVPECIVISSAPDTLASAIHWTNRQTLVTRFYNPPFWLTAWIFHVLGNLLGWGLLAWGLAGLWDGSLSTAEVIALAAGTWWLVHLWIYGLLMATPLESLLRPRGIALGAKRWTLVLAAPLASLLQGLNSLNSLTTRRITWAGVTYQIDNFERMRVV